MKWYELNYTSHRDWILDNLGALGLSGDEAIVALMIDFMNEHHMPVGVQDLAIRTGMEEAKVNTAVSVLCSKKYLDIRAAAGKVNFSLNGLFEAETARNENVLDSSLFEAFQTEFKRLLTPVEMQKISDWNRTTDRHMILLALRQASVYQKLSFPYIEKILANWKAQGLSADQIENGDAGWIE